MARLMTMMSLMSPLTRGSLAARLARLFAHRTSDTPTMSATTWRAFDTRVSAILADASPAALAAWQAEKLASGFDRPGRWPEVVEDEGRLPLDTAALLALRRAVLPVVADHPEVRARIAARLERMDESEADDDG